MNREADNGRQKVADCICVHGARTHNLQNLDLALPRDRLIVVTGPSGSGKSSLAFDTLYAEGQRQYIESLSPYARQFLHQLERPDVDLIEGLQPTISIDQRAGSHNPRSTVATVTEIYDYLRLLYARLGEATCYRCGTPIRQQSPEQILETLLCRPTGTRMMILAPIVRGRKGQHHEAIEDVRKAGFVRARIDGVIVEVNDPPELVPQKAHYIEAVVDRIVIREGVEPRLAESIRLAIRHGDGLVLASCEVRNGAAELQWRDELFSTLYSCPDCKISYEELEPRTFSFNSPYGACPACEGLGVRVAFDPDLVIADPSLSLEGGAIAAWKGATPAAMRKYRELLKPWSESNGGSWTTPIADLKPKALEHLLRGDGKQFLGLLVLLEKECSTTANETRHQMLEAFRGQMACSECKGSRLRLEARAVRLAGKAIHEATAANVAAAQVFFQSLEFPEDRRPIAQPITSEILSRLDFLSKVGLGYLTLDRPAETLSGGELQRVRLASGLGSGLVGVCYVLDEPSIGLHPRDNQRLIEALESLQARGNTVMVVEHDEAIMRRADWIVDLGPGAGRNGGRIVAEGTADEVSANPASLTGRYLAGVEKIPVPSDRRRVAMTRAITIEGVTTNNLKSITARFPFSALVCVTGVSGSGKSSLLNETLARALVRRLGGTAPKPGPHTSLRGASQIDKIVEIDQSPIGRTPRSNPATYTGVFDEIRKVFTGTRDARALGYKSGRFSFNIKGGRCEECQGQGQRRIEMNFLPDIYVPCSVCEGKRFNRHTLEIRYRGLSIADVLDLRVDEAVEFFQNHTSIARLLGSLQEVGLGYVTLGQSSTTLSGGEAQRIKLANELGRVDTGKTFYILDEPTTGLHFDDIRKLLAVLGRLVDLGNTVVVIEHNVDVMKTADWIIDLGPDGGDNGGYVVATGTPEQVAALDDNCTGQFLRRVLNGEQGK
ncbi:MAG: excinuclease ABC subunit UvrA [Thermoguttaceae bacterium]